MAHKCLKGRGKPRGGSIKKSLKSASRLAKDRRKGKVTARNKGEKAQRKGKLSASKKGDEAAAGATVPVPRAAAAGAPRLTKKEASAQALAEKQHRALYSAGERILLVGEGNFSFARALCKALGSGNGVYATAFDGEPILLEKYEDAAEFRKDIEEQLGGTTLLGVDATRLHSVREFRGAFRKVVWNFPHLGGGEADLEKSAEEHRSLLANFFKSALKCLDPEHVRSEIHVALKTGEPYKSWKVVQTARAACPELELRATLPFVAAAWAGYAHRRTAGFDERFSKADNEELANGAKVYVFSRRRQEPQR